MATAPPVFFDPSQIYLPMPQPLPPLAPISRKSRSLDILKVFVGLIIALILGTILAVLIFLPRTSSGIDIHESNEKIATLQRQSNEKIAELQRESNENLTRLQLESSENLARLQFEQQLHVDDQRQIHQENLTERHRLEDRFIKQEHRAQDLGLVLQQSRQQLEIEEKRIRILLEERELAEQRRKEDRERENSDALSDFMQEVIAAKEPLTATTFATKVHSLIRRFDPVYKSSLISFLYKVQLLNVGDSDPISLDLSGANLKELDLDDMDLESGEGKFC
jgi:ABC-type multidrug transport system fused ATPase/permease subunit